MSDQPDQPASFGDIETAGTTWGDMAGEPVTAPAERHVVGMVCICPVEGPLDQECPQHGNGPSTPEGLARVSQATAQAAEQGTLDAPEGTIVAPETPVHGARSQAMDTGQMPTPDQVLDELADKKIVEAKPEDLQGTVTVLRDVLLSRVITAAQRHSHGERCTVDVQIMPMPHPQEPGMTVIGAAIYHEIPGMVLGEPIANAMIVTSVQGWEQPWVDAQLQAMWRGAREARSQQPEQMRAAQANAQAARQARGNGHTPPGGGSGLILPGQGFPEF